MSLVITCLFYSGDSMVGAALSNGAAPTKTLYVKLNDSFERLFTHGIF